MVEDLEIYARARVTDLFLLYDSIKRKGQGFKVSSD